MEVSVVFGVAIMSVVLPPHTTNRRMLALRAGIRQHIAFFLRSLAWDISLHVLPRWKNVKRDWVRRDLFEVGG